MDVTYGRQRHRPETFGSRYFDETLVPAAMEAIDTDGDGRQEILVHTMSTLFIDGIVEVPAHASLLEWNGRAVADVTDARLPEGAFFVVRDFYVADFNGDGLDDAFLSNHGSELVDDERQLPPGEPNALWLSDGDGGLRDASDGLPPQQDFGHSAVVADFDGDGDLDIVSNDLGTAEGNRGPELLLNDGNGVFTSAGWWTQDGTQQNSIFGPEFAAFDRPYRIALADVGDDGVPDFYTHILHERGTFSEVVTRGFAVNDGSGRFTLQTRDDIRDPQFDPPFGMFTDRMRSFDMDGDGDLDILTLLEFSDGFRTREGVDGPNMQLGTYYQLLRNDGPSGYTDVSHRIEGQAGGALLPDAGPYLLFNLDLDGDGDQDLIHQALDPETFQPAPRWFENDGAGRFTALPSRDAPFVLQSTTSTATGCRMSSRSSRATTSRR